jgi:hypothetical protein
MKGCDLDWSGPGWGPIVTVCIHFNMVLVAENALGASLSVGSARRILPLEVSYFSRIINDINIHVFPPPYHQSRVLQIFKRLKVQELIRTV